MLIKTLGLMLVFGLSLQGWGLGCRRVFRMGRGGWPLTVCLGLGAVVFLGGILNLIRLAVPMSLAGVIAGGIILFALDCKQNCGGLAASLRADGRGRGDRDRLLQRPDRNRTERIEGSESKPSDHFTGGNGGNEEILACACPSFPWLPFVKRFEDRPGAPDLWTRVALGALVTLVMAFTIWTQLPPKVYNFADDFQKYFAYPVRMLQTGTVAGSALSAMGSETLGAQSFLQGFIAASAPLVYLNGLDAVFGLFLCLVLALHWAHGRRDLLAAGVLSVLGVVLINPQYVNISALYLGSALMMALIVLTADDREMKANAEGPSPAAMGLLYAAILALKTTFALFVALHGLAVAAALWAFTRQPVRALRWMGRTALAGGLFLAPWLGMHGAHYLAAWRAPAATDVAAGDLPPLVLEFFSTKPLLNGSTMAHYTWIAIVLALGAVIAVWRARVPSRALFPRRVSNPEAAERVSNPELVEWAAWMLAAAGLVGALSFVVIEPILGPTLAGYDAGLRYFTPFAIGIAPAVLGGLAWLLSNVADEVTRPSAGQTASLPRPLRWALLLIAFIPIAAFWPSLRDRTLQAWRSGSILSFPVATTPAYFDYNRQVLDGPVRATVARVQSLVPAGEPLIAWINAPFYLDYARNLITDVDAAGLTTGWAEMPPARYVIWEYSGVATRSAETYALRARHPSVHERMLAVRGLAFFRRLEALANQGQILYNDGGTVVFRLAEAPRS